MAAINPYLNFVGNTEEAFNFYKSVFGGEFSSIVRFKETPEAGKLSKEDQEKLMHVSLPIGKGQILMGTDALESAGHTLTFGNNFSLCVSAESEAEADKIFTGLSAGGKITVPIAKMFWGAYFGMCFDKFNVQWMVSFDPQFLSQLK
jgi:PhnB protein